MFLQSGTLLLLRRENYTCCILKKHIRVLFKVNRDEVRNRPVWKCQPKTTAYFPQLFLNYFFMAQIQPEVFFSDLLTVQKKENSFYYTAGVQLSQQYLRSESRAMDFTW